MIKTLTKYLLILSLFTTYACNSANKTTTNNSAKNPVETRENKIKGERFFFSAQKEKVKENYLEALKLFEQSVKVYPLLDASYFEIAQINLMQKDYASSLSNVEKALEITPKNKWYREFYGELLSANGNYKDATETFHSLRMDYPNLSDYYFDEAYFLQKQNKNKEALKVYEALEEKKGIQEEISNEKYKIYLKESNSKDAEAELLKLTKAYPNRLKYLNTLASFYFSNGQEEKAVATFLKILEQNPGNALALTSLADYHRKKGNEEKYKEYSKLAFENKNISIDTKIKVLYNYIEQYEKGETDLKEAFEYAELLRKSHPEDAKSWAISGDLYNLDKQYLMSLEMYDKSLSIRKDIFTVWQQVFFLQSDLEKYTDLIETTEKAKEYFPNQALVYYFNGFGFQQEKNYTSSNQSYEKAMKMSSKNIALKIQLLSSLGENANRQKDYPKSDEYFEKALVLDPNNEMVLNNYSYYLSLRAENLERAKEMSKKSLELSPDNPTYLDTYAWILYKKAEYKEAKSIQEKAIKLSEKPSGDMFEHFGDMLFKTNKLDEALKYWQKAKDLGDGSEFLDKKIADKKLYE